MVRRFAARGDLLRFKLANFNEVVVDVGGAGVLYAYRFITFYLYLNNKFRIKRLCALGSGALGALWALGFWARPLHRVLFTTDRE